MTEQISLCPCGTPSPIRRGPLSERHAPRGKDRQRSPKVRQLGPEEIMTIVAAAVEGRGGKPLHMRRPLPFSGEAEKGLHLHHLRCDGR